MAPSSISRIRSLAVPIPREYIPAIEKGVKEAMTNGVLAGYPLTGIHCEVYDGSLSRS